MLLSTTQTLDGVYINEYLDVVTSSVVIGTDIISDFFASITDVVGGTSRTYQKKIMALNNEALNLLKQEAANINADAIIGIKIDVEAISGKGNQMFLISASGTAVTIFKHKKVINMIEDMIDEAQVYQRVNDLPLRSMKLLRLINEVDPLEFTADLERKVIKFYKLIYNHLSDDSTLKVDTFYDINPKLIGKLIIPTIRELSSREAIHNNEQLATKYTIEKLLSKLTPPHSFEINKELFNYYRIIGQYDKAEDTLFFLLEDKKNSQLKKEIMNEGIKFYNDLIKKSDDELVKGNLPREEVMESLNTLEKDY